MALPNQPKCLSVNLVRSLPRFLVGFTSRLLWVASFHVDTPSFANMSWTHFDGYQPREKPHPTPFHPLQTPLAPETAWAVLRSSTASIADGYAWSTCNEIRQYIAANLPMPFLTLVARFNLVAEVVTSRVGDWSIASITWNQPINYHAYGPCS